MAVTTNSTELVREGYRRFAKQDIEGVLALFSPEISWTIPGPEGLGGTYRGHAGVGEFFGKIGEVWETLEIHVDEVIADGDRVIVLGRHIGKGAGGEFAVGFVHAWRTEGDQLVSLVEYTDTEKLRQALRA
jgi:uncharacterized protein